MTQSEFTLEESLVMGNFVYNQNIQRLFDKYDRDFSLDEEGGALVSMYETDLVFEEQVANLFQDDLTLNRSRSSPSTSESEIEVDTGVEVMQKMDIIRNTDTTNIADLVVKAKREINWDEEERKYHMKKQKQSRRKQQASSEDEVDSDLNISGSLRSVTNWAKKTKRSRKRRKLSMAAPRFCDSSAHLNSLSNGVEVGGARFNKSTVLESSYYDSGNDDISYVAPTSNRVGNQREQKTEIVLESSYYDSGNDDISSVAPTFNRVGNQREQKTEIVLESSYYDSS